MYMLVDYFVYEDTTVGQKWPHTPQWGRGLYRGARPPSNRVLENNDRYLNMSMKKILVIIDF